jgi:hypothetical protein
MLGPAALIALFVLIPSISIAQDTSPFVVKQGQVLQVRLLQQISSGSETAGEAVKMESASDLVIDGRVIVRKGAPLTAAIVSAKKKTKLTPGGRVSLHITDVEMVDGERLALDTTQGESGGGPNAKVYKGLVIASIALLSPAGTATALLWRGQEIVLPEGTLLEARVAKEAPFDPEKFEPAALVNVDGPSADPASTAEAEKNVTLQIETNVGDGSVWLGSEFVGESPMKLSVKPGIYTVKVVRAGYKPWQQKVVIHGDPLTLRVTMDKKKVGGT